MADADLFGTTFGADGRGIPASLTRGQLIVEVAALEDGTLRIDGPLDEATALASAWVNAVSEPVLLGSEQLGEPDQPRRFYQRFGLLP
jgi:hypothetical protein